MEEKNKIFKEEYEKYKIFYDRTNERTIALILMDIIAYLMEEKEIEVTENGKVVTKKIKDYNKFDELVEKNKQFLESINNKPEFDLQNSINETLTNAKNLQQESLYSMRVLSWVIDELSKNSEGENKNA